MELHKESIRLTKRDLPGNNVIFTTEAKKIDEKSSDQIPDFSIPNNSTQETMIEGIKTEIIDESKEIPFLESVTNMKVEMGDLEEYPSGDPTMELASDHNASSTLSSPDSNVKIEQEIKAGSSVKDRTQ